MVTFKINYEKMYAYKIHLTFRKKQYKVLVGFKYFQMKKSDNI